jgi:hypothetical protein
MRREPPEDAPRPRETVSFRSRNSQVKMRTFRWIFEQQEREETEDDK